MTYYSRGFGSLRAHYLFKSSVGVVVVKDVTRPHRGLVTQQDSSKPLDYCKSPYKGEVGGIAVSNSCFGNNLQTQKKGIAIPSTQVRFLPHSLATLARSIASQSLIRLDGIGRLGRHKREFCKLVRAQFLV